MYKVILKNQYKSLITFNYDFPSFVVLTGINGSGKTQLLEAMEKMEFTDIIDENENYLSYRKLIPAHSLLPKEDDAPSHSTINPATALWESYNQAKSGSGGFRQNPPPTFEQRLRPRNLLKIKAVAQYAGKNITELDFDDFKEHTPVSDANNTDDFLNQRFSVIFENYFDKYYKNEVRKIRYESGESNKPYLTPEEFVVKYGNPRKLVNNLIERANLDYEFNEPLDEYDEGRPFLLRLKNKINENEIVLSELSSGEKVIMSLVFALYNLELDFQFPQVILLDEPDASLHPSMAKQFLDVVEKAFVKDLGIKVIMTTHSPSTVALVPEESLFVMNKTEPRLEKIAKDKAIKILTDGVPTLSINYENRRQIIVESENDVYFYGKIYAKLSKQLNPEISLTFISSGETKTNTHGEKVANCGQVINATSVFRNAGNKLVFGIIDWDEGNQESDGIKVLGENKRYAIENYIFDPILIAALLLDEGVVGKDELGLEDNENYSDFKNFPSDKLQKISSFITDKIVTKLSPTNDVEILPVKYKNGLEIKIPKCYLHHPGHSLEQLLNSYLIKNFGSLKRFHQPDAIRKQLIDKFIENMPDFISQDVLDVFQSIQEA